MGSELYRHKLIHIHNICCRITVSNTLPRRRWCYTTNTTATDLVQALLYFLADARARWQTLGAGNPRQTLISENPPRNTKRCSRVTKPSAYPVQSPGISRGRTDPMLTKGSDKSHLQGVLNYTFCFSGGYTQKLCLEQTSVQPYAVCTLSKARLGPGNQSSIPRPLAEDSVSSYISFPCAFGTTMWFICVLCTWSCAANERGLCKGSQYLPRYIWCIAYPITLRYGSRVLD